MRFSSHLLNHGGPGSLPHTPNSLMHSIHSHLPQLTAWESRCLSPQLSWGLLGDPWFPAQHHKSRAEDCRFYWQPESKEFILINPPHKNDGLQPSLRKEPANPEWKKNAGLASYEINTTSFWALFWVTQKEQHGWPRSLERSLSRSLMAGVTGAKESPLHHRPQKAQRL